MYKAAVRALMRHSVAKLNSGDFALLLKMASSDFELAFPGDNSWSTMFEPTKTGRERHVTHNGIEQGKAFAERFVREGIQFHIEDILVNGPPWNTRIALRVHDFIPGPAGQPDVYNNRAVAFLEVRWGRLVRWEDYEDTQRVAEWDRAQAAGPQPAASLGS
ncbi:MAG: nuclear transport factor 2 family protein [Acidimicrobiia bacterium]|nr:nuclear transport factor 2 family protein [Acidimicrobiia bacterium]